MISMKIVTVSELTKIVPRLKRKDQTIVHCHGCFDFLHVGHLRHLEEAKEYGDVLIVTITSDRFVNKGPCRPVFNHHDRADMLAAITCVDYVAINDSPDAISALTIIKPDVYVKGADYRDMRCPEFETAKKVGAQLFVTTPSLYSTSDLLVRLRA